jgi:hypothetical protein
MNLRSMTVLILMASAVLAQTRDTRVQAPRFWNDRELADWALPVAGLNVRPAHFPEADYYAAPDAEWVRTYPVYFPGGQLLRSDGFWAPSHAERRPAEDLLQDSRSHGFRSGTVPVCSSTSGQSKSERSPRCEGKAGFQQRRVRRLSYASAVHEQQADVGKRIHASGGPSAPG